jgi:hypothetical protein
MCADGPRDIVELRDSGNRSVIPRASISIMVDRDRAIT